VEPRRRDAVRDRVARARRCRTATAAGSAATRTSPFTEESAPARGVGGGQARTAGRADRGTAGYHWLAMESFVQGWSLTILLCALIVLVFLAAWLHVHRELVWVRRVDRLPRLCVGRRGAAKAVTRAAGHPRRGARDPRVEGSGVAAASDPQLADARATPRAALAFWVDLLRQLGLLGTVLGIGLSSPTRAAISPSCSVRSRSRYGRPWPGSQPRSCCRRASR